MLKTIYNNLRIIYDYFTYFCKMKKRKEVQLEQEVINKLQKLAEAENRSLKSFMEKVLIDIIKDPSMEEFVKEHGFASEKEFHHLMATVDLSSPEKLKAFEEWKFNDGSKTGLLELQFLNNR